MGRLNQSESKFCKLLESGCGDEGLSSYTQSLRLQVYQSGRKKIDVGLGDDYSYYDLASLTKVIFTTTSVMRLLDQKKLLLKQKISNSCFDWPHKHQTIEMVLKHHAGLHWWNNYYERLELKKGNIKERRAHLWSLLKQEKVRKNPSQAIYSDLDFLLLGYVLESITERDLFSLWEELSNQLSLDSIHFCKNNRPNYKRKEYAPTEHCPWRDKTLQGEVHDDNTWALKGVSSHAGLFGSIADVSRWGLMLRRSYFDISGKKLAKNSTVRKFCQRSVKANVGDWGLGFMKPTLGRSSCGSKFSPSSVGHTGFTGTSFWWDPKRDLMVTLLSNRVHPSRDNKKFVSLRPLIHNWVVEALS